MISVIESYKIVGLAVEKTKPSRNSEATAMRQIHLELSGQPTGEWVAIFDQERKFPRHSMWRHAWVERNYIVVDCVPQEIESHHLHDLKADVENTNKKYAELIHQRAQVYEENKVQQDAERTQLNELAEKLKFD